MLDPESVMNNSVHVFFDKPGSCVVEMDHELNGCWTFDLHHSLHWCLPLWVCVRQLYWYTYVFSSHLFQTSKSMIPFLMQYPIPGNLQYMAASASPVRENIYIFLNCSIQRKERRQKWPNIVSDKILKKCFI
jgi:hypothetical protein